MKTLFILLVSIYSISISDCGTEPCYQDREITKKISDTELMCSINGDLVLFLHKTNGKRYAVCNPETYELQDSTIYSVSGITYKVKPNERWPGTPFEITKIKN